jgi:hypothetical protein
MSSHSISIGPYSRPQKFRDFFTLSLFVVQLVVWQTYDTWWALMLPVLIFGTLAAYFTARDDAMFNNIWLKFRKSFTFFVFCLLVFAVIGFGFAGFWNPYDASTMVAAVIFGDAAYVYGATAVGFFIRQLRNGNNSAR